MNENDDKTGRAAIVDAPPPESDGGCVCHIKKKEVSLSMQARYRERRKEERT